MVVQTVPLIDPVRWRALEPLLDEALDLEPAERRRWLEDLSAESPALASDVSALLFNEVLADRSGFLAARTEADLAGLEIGAYTIDRALGSGGMGSVWLAHRTDGRFEGQAAVKLLNLATAEPPGQARFRREGSCSPGSRTRASRGCSTPA